MIDVLRDEVVPVAIRGALYGALLLFVWVVLVIGGSLATLVAYAALKSPVFLWLYESMALVALLPLAAYGLFRLVERATHPGKA